MKTRTRFLAVAVLVTWLLSNTILASAQEVTKTMRWDILSARFEVTGPTTRTLTFSPGGTGSPQTQNGSKIKLTGSGTFSTRESKKVTGGGTWETFDNKGNSTGKGTYEVISLVRFVQVPGRQLPTLTFTRPDGTIITVTQVDTIGDLADARGGVGVFRVEFTDEDGDESQGLLTVNCFVNTSPREVIGLQEGVSVIKGFANYFRINGDIFYHILPEEDEEKQ